MTIEEDIGETNYTQVQKNMKWHANANAFGSTGRATGVCVKRYDEKGPIKCHYVLFTTPDNFHNYPFS